MKNIRTHLLTAATFLFVGLLLSTSFDQTREAEADRLWFENDTNPAALNEDAPVNLGTFSRLAENLSPAVVNIHTERAAQTRGRLNRRFLDRHRGRGHAPRNFVNRGMGSGFIIHPDGWILTNNHVVEASDRIQVRLFNENTYEARLIGRDPRTDVALIKIEPEERLIHAPLGDSDELSIAEWVIAIGNPFGLSHTVTAGIVSAKHRQEVNPDGRQQYANFIQTDASINPGNSGGPLINVRGQVVGINTAINAGGQGIGFAIPINMVKVLIPQLRTGHVERSWLGVRIQEVTAQLAESLGLERSVGALVAEVVPQGPAAEAGIQAGDVIIGFGEDIVQSSRDLPWLASTAGIDATVTVTVWRERAEHSVRVTLGRLPGDVSRSGKQPSDRDPREQSQAETASPSGTGLTVQPLSPDLASQYHIAGKLGGVLVTAVEANSPAAQAGAETGDLIVKVSNRTIDTVEEFNRQLSRVEPGRVVMILVQRGSQKVFLAFTRG